MVIRVRQGNYILECNGCNLEVLGGYSEAEAKRTLEELGWSSLTVEYSEHPRLYCPECSRKLMEQLRGKKE